jgi:LmbE family N-acetylglucosaminyl deacetylase
MKSAWRRTGGLALAIAFLVPLPAAAAGYVFKDGRSRAMDVELTEVEGALRGAWPAAEPDWDTALLGLEVATAEPHPAEGAWLEVAVGGAGGRQYFEPGERGLRWLNLTPYRERLAAGAGLEIRGRGMSAAPGTARLRLFRNALELRRPILVLAPHPDDAEIAAFGVYAGRDATVVTVTVGNAGNMNYEAVVSEPAAHYTFKGKLRLIDSITVPWQGGIPPARCFNLGYFDARLAEMHKSPRQAVPEMFSPNTDIGPYRRLNIATLLGKGPRASTWESLVADVQELLRKVKPATIVAPHPQLDTHLDHQFTTVALAEALARWRKPVALLLYTNHASENRYPPGPADSVVSLPPPPGEVVLDRIYSHALSPELQRGKLFAIESMHDIRFNPTRQYQLALGDGRTLLPEPPGPAPDIDYLRRGPRPNELYFVYDRVTLPPMIDAFLKGAAR